MVIYKINFYSQRKTLSLTILLTIVILALVIYGILSVDIYTSLGAIVAGASSLVFLSYILYIEYLFKSLGTELRINHFEKKMSFKIRNRVAEYHFDEITEIEKVCSFSVAERRLQWSPTDSFNYYLIKFKGSRQIIITSLLTDKIVLHGKKIRIKKIFIPFIFPNENKLE